MTTTLNKLIENKSKEWKKVFPKETIFSSGTGGIIWKTDNELNKELDFLSQSIQSGYELAIKKMALIVNHMAVHTTEAASNAIEETKQLQLLLKGEK